MIKEKKLAAKTAIEHVEHGMTLGLGTGSSAAFAIQYLGNRVREGLKVQGIPTSEATRQLALSEKIPLTDFAHASRIDLCIDGTDEIDSKLNMIKGGGGALLREKIVAASSDRYIIIGDLSKKVNQLGSFPLPVEVISFGWQVVYEKLKHLKYNPSLRYQNEVPFQTDEQNYIIDCNLSIIDAPFDLDIKLNQIPGVVENGLFLGMCDMLILASENEIIIKEKS